MYKRLFDMVENNNYIELKELIDTTPNINLVKESRGRTLLYVSVEYRAKECFDILIDIPSVKVLEKLKYRSALYKATEYYINGKNESNRYYIEQLIDKGYDTHYALLASISDSELFFYLFDKSDKTKLQVLQLIHCCLQDNYIYAFECLLYTSINRNLNIKYEILNEILIKDNMNALEIYIKAPTINIKEYNFILYNALEADSIITFNYFYNFYSKLTKEELNNIPNVNNITQLFYISKFSNFNIKYEMINKILKLDINFGNIPAILVDIYIKSLTKHLSLGAPNLDKLGYEIMILFFENKKVLTNPLLEFDIPNFTKAISRTFANQASQTRFNNIAAQFFDICMSYNYKPTNEILTILNKYKIHVAK